MQKFIVDEDYSSRLDSFLVKKLPELSRSSIKKLINSGLVKVNTKLVKASYKLHPAETVEVEFDPKALIEIPAVELPIIYEDSDVIVINKPAGILTHSKGSFNPEATVATFVRPKIKDIKGERAGIVHRLDRATSGVIIVAKNQKALDWLQKQFASRKAKKTYVAVLSGQLNPDEAVIDMPIARNPRSPKTFHTSSSGKPAITQYKVIKETVHHTVLELYPKTGRTHQLRVHMKQIKHPIVGDNLYDGEANDQLLLHAQKLSIMLPNKQSKTFEAKLPDYFKDYA